MKTVIRYIGDYARGLDKWILTATTLFTAMLVFINYRYGLDRSLAGLPGPALFAGRYLLFLGAFLIPYGFYRLFTRAGYLSDPKFLLLAMIAPAFFALKTAISVNFSWPDDEAYWNRVLYWPVLLIMLSGLIGLTYLLTKQRGSFYGLTAKNLNWRPYLLMLLIMTPLIALAATQADFQQTYPKLQNLAGAQPLDQIPVWKKLLYELSYGSDFLGIELFFRGFLIIAFIKWAGKDAILPMACFYCTIHFGKPLAECISSYFGGILLGILVYNTRSVVGGLVVHLGIAWMMEVAGFWAS